MAGVCTCPSFRRNFPLGCKNELAEGLLGAPTKDNNTFIPSPTVFRAQTLTLDLPPALATSSIEKLCKQLLKTYAAIIKLLE